MHKLFVRSFGLLVTALMITLSPVAIGVGDPILEGYSVNYDSPKLSPDITLEDILAMDTRGLVHPGSILSDGDSIMTAASMGAGCAAYCWTTDCQYSWCGMVCGGSCY